MKTVYPPGVPILPNLLRWHGLEVYEYICALAALHLRQTRRLQDLGNTLFYFPGVPSFSLVLLFPVIDRFIFLRRSD